MDDGAVGRSTVEIARLLLERGADPNAGFLWNGSYAFTALTGAFGRGEDNMNELAHPHAQELATLLLDAGADPNDSQTLYNRHFEENDDHLILLFAYGLGRQSTGPWLKRTGDRSWLGSPSTLLIQELCWAAMHNFPNRVKLLVEHGVDVNGMIPNTGLDRAPLHSAAGGGDLEMVKLLIDLGADPQLRDDPFHAAPIGWAKYGQHQDVVDYLFRYASIFDAVHLGGVEREMSLLEQSPSLAQARDDDGDPLAAGADFADYESWLTRHGVDLSATGRGGARLLERALAHGWAEFADLLRRHGARTS